MADPRVQAVPVAQPAAPSYPAAAASPYGIPPPKHPGPAYNVGASREVGKLSLFTSVLRILQVILSMIGFSIMASATVDDGISWEDLKAYKFCLSMLVIVFVWAIVLAILDLMEAFAKVAFGGGIKPYIVALGDLIFAFLLFGAACSAATIDTDILPVFNFPTSWESKVRAATAFAFLTWFVLVPTMVINVALVASELFSS